jgi:rare lipoprotein A
MVVNHLAVMVTPEPFDLPHCTPCSRLESGSFKPPNQSNKERKRMIEMRAKLITVGLLGAAATLPIDHAKTDQIGHASWYSLPNNITANGEQMDPNELTAAHRSLPLGMTVLVENLSNGRSVVVRINDRGPFIGGRIIDLSKAAAESIGMIGSGVATVRVITPEGGALAAHESESNFTSGKLLAAVDKIEITAMDDHAKVQTAAQPIPAKPESKHPKSGASRGKTAAATIPAKPESAKPPTLSPPRVAAVKTSSQSKHAKSGASRGKIVAAQSSTKSSVKTAVKSSVKTTAERSVKTAAKTASDSSEKTVFKRLMKIAARAIAPMASARPSSPRAGASR